MDLLRGVWRSMSRAVAPCPFPIRRFEVSTRMRLFLAAAEHKELPSTEPPGGRRMQCSLPESPLSLSHIWQRLDGESCVWALSWSRAYSLGPHCDPHCLAPLTTYAVHRRFLKPRWDPLTIYPRRSLFSRTLKTPGRPVTAVINSLGCVEWKTR